MHWIKELFKSQEGPRKPGGGDIDSTINQDLLAAIFGTEEAKNHLLNVTLPDEITEEKVIVDGQMMDYLLGTPAWSFYQRALWRNLLTALRRVLAAPTLEEREGKRHEVMAILGSLRVPYNFRIEKNRLMQQKDALTRQKQTFESSPETLFQ